MDGHGRSVSELVLLLMLASQHAAYELSVCGYPLLQDLTRNQVPSCKPALTEYAHMAEKDKAVQVHSVSSFRLSILHVI